MSRVIWADSELRSMTGFAVPLGPPNAWALMRQRPAFSVMSLSVTSMTMSRSALYWRPASAAVSVTSTVPVQAGVATVDGGLDGKECGDHLTVPAAISKVCLDHGS